jgi:hypothetical protein
VERERERRETECTLRSTSLLQRLGSERGERWREGVSLFILRVWSGLLSGPREKLQRTLMQA